MRIGIIGSGHIGGTLAELLARAGHEVLVSNSRDPGTLAGLVGRLGGRGRAGTPAEAAAFGDVVVVSIPLGRWQELPAEPLAGKVVVDTCNYYPQRDGRIDDLDAGRLTSSELVASHLDHARLVKAFNTIYWERLRDQGRPPGAPGRLAIPLAGDDPEAKRLVAGLIDQLGFDPVDTGDLAGGGRRQQPGSPIYNQPLTRAQVEQRLAG
jgi:predicted dinucleotide-binding enzyme